MEESISPVPHGKWDLRGLVTNFFKEISLQMLISLIILLLYLEEHRRSPRGIKNHIWSISYIISSYGIDLIPEGFSVITVLFHELTAAWYGGVN